MAYRFTRLVVALLAFIATSIPLLVLAQHPLDAHVQPPFLSAPSRSQASQSSDLEHSVRNTESTAAARFRTSQDAGPSRADAGDGQPPSQGPTESQSRQGAFDAAEVSRGQVAFESSCTQCHDAERALEKQKSLAGWLATVRRMAGMEGAEISPDDIRPIAVYLASLSGAEGAADTQAQIADGLGSGLSLGATISTLWRGGNDNLENPDFFPDVWPRVDWQPDGPLSARVTACTSCHSDVTGGSGFTVEFVEAAAHYDLLHWLREKRGIPTNCPRQLEIGIKGGRFVVPFGAFAAMSHPGIYRTVTNPLMYIMGRQVNPIGSRPPVLPMPYSDEGVNLDVSVPLLCDWTATLDAYAVNGLQGFGPGVRFMPSRSYADNNSEPAAGGRLTLGNQTVRMGTSVMSGRMQDEGLAPLDYHFAGADAVVRLDDCVRFYFEYAMRKNDSDFGAGQIVYGTVYELEVLLCAGINGLARYDNLQHHDSFGDLAVNRFTWGINAVLPGGSLLIINHERWRFPDPEPEVDVVGLRWVATF
jgi:mono/diheme cytochrome c family protein